MLGLTFWLVLLCKREKEEGEEMVGERTEKKWRWEGKKDNKNVYSFEKSIGSTRFFPATIPDYSW